MKYVIIPYIALGLVLSMLIGIEYNFQGDEYLPTYYGTPFVFAQKSLASSMEYFYSVSGLVLNVIVWSSLLFLINFFIEKYNLKEKIKYAYYTVVGLLIAFASLFIIVDYAMIANGFEKDLNYWYWDIDRKAQDWGGTYEGELVSGKK